MGRKLGNFFTNREHALRGYISSITASTYRRAKRLCVIRRYGPKPKKICQIKMLNFWRTEFGPCRLLVIVPSIYWRGDALSVNRKHAPYQLSVVRRQRPIFIASIYWRNDIPLRNQAMRTEFGSSIIVCTFVFTFFSFFPFWCPDTDQGKIIRKACRIRLHNTYRLLVYIVQSKYTP
jgi:hypothetical protein